jgi:hypothetical protein
MTFSVFLSSCVFFCESSADQCVSSSVFFELHPPPHHPLYQFFSQLAFIIIFSAGIVAGISLSQTILYHSFVHFGYFILDVSDKYNHDITIFSFSSLESSNVIVYSFGVQLAYKV